MTYKQSIDYIHSREVFGSRPGLERIRDLCEKLSNPQKSLKFIHIAGTNGKGSVCSMISSVLRCEGLKVGLYTSPYISFFEERIKINGEPIPKKRLAEIIEKIKFFEDKSEDGITEFEVITAAAFVYFYEEKCDIVVLETGLGGRLDATNIIENPIVSVITGIGLDHTAVLGQTTEKIAYEKGGIIKTGCNVVLASVDEGARRVLTDIAKTRSAPVTEVDYSRITNKRFSLDGTEFSVQPYGKINLSLNGVYQADNAATAITALEVLKDSGLKISDEHIICGLGGAVWPARFEVIKKDPTVIYDGAHNQNGAAALAENIKTVLGSKAVLICGVMADKAYPLIAKTLAPYIKKVFTVTPDNPRALSSAALADEFICCGVNAKAHNTVSEAVEEALLYAKKENLPLVISGTLYMYKQIMEII